MLYSEPNTKYIGDDAQVLHLEYNYFIKDLWEQLGPLDIVDLVEEYGVDGSVKYT